MTLERVPLNPKPLNPKPLEKLRLKPAVAKVQTNGSSNRGLTVQRSLGFRAQGLGFRADFGFRVTEGLVFTRQHDKCTNTLFQKYS